ncbi:MAG: cbb3-type cytochrome c oxidase subunit I, partial [Candidatus Limnocylindria bacterium]
MKPGLLRAVLGAAIGAGSLILAGTVGMEITDGEILGLGYLLALIGFLLGIGAFRFWLTWAVGREVNAEEEHAAHGTAGDWRRYFRFTTDHKVIGVQYLATAFALFLVAGSAAMLMRFELAQPGLVLGKEAYNEIFSTHGAMMITVA